MKVIQRKYYKACVNILIAVLVLLGCIFLLPKILGFFWPFVVGWIIAMIANPLVHFLESKLKIRRKASSALVIIMVLAVIIFLAYIVIVKVIEEVSNLMQDMPLIVENMESELLFLQSKILKVTQDGKFPLDLSSTVEKVTEWLQNFIESFMSKDSNVRAVGNFVSNVPSALIGIIMMILSAYCFVAQRDYVFRMVNHFTPSGLKRIFSMIGQSCKKAIGGYFKAQLQIEFWIYLLLVVGLLILQVKYAALIALGIAALDFLPFFGTGAVMIPWALINFLGNDYKMTIGLLIIWALGQLVRQIIQPKIVGESIGLPAIPTLFLLYIGYKVGSVIGMIVAMPIGIILVNMDEAGVFDNFKDSVKILVNGINQFRMLTPKDKKQEATPKASSVLLESSFDIAYQEPIRTLVKEEIEEQMEKIQKRREERKDIRDEKEDGRKADHEEKDSLEKDLEKGSEKDTEKKEKNPKMDSNKEEIQKDLKKEFGDISKGNVKNESDFL